MGRFVKGDIVDSNARPNRLFTADANIILYKAAALDPAK